MSVSVEVAGTPPPVMAPVLERRASPRRDVRLEMSILLAQSRMGAAAYTVNVGPSSALIRTLAPLHVGHVYDVYFLDSEGVQQMQARVLREEPNNHYAVQFDAPLPLD